MLGKQPSTIDGCRSPIVDKLGNSLFNISKDENLACLLDSFLRDRPKGRSGIPSWNFSLAVHQLRLHLIQSRRPLWSIWPSRWYSSWPLGRASAKMRFMPGKTDILDTNPIGQGVLVSITQLSILELAGHRVSSVAPGVITALAPILDRSLKSDRSLCPVRALRYYLDRTSDRIRRWFLSPLRKVLTKTSHLPLSPLGSSRLWSYVMSSLTRRPTLYIRLKPMMSGPLMLLRSSSREFP